MKKQVLFVQGGGEGAYEADRGLAVTLQDGLGDEYEVVYPKFISLEDTEYAPWKIPFQKELAALAGGVILVGHSLGGTVLLRYLSEETSDKDIAGLFIIAAPYWGAEDWLREDFSAKLSRIPRIFLYHSRDDEVIPFTHLAQYAEKLPQATVRALDGRGHMFSPGIPELVEDIQGV